MTDPVPVSSLGILANPEKDEARRIIPDLIRMIEDRGLTYTLADTLVPLVGMKDRSCPLVEMRHGVDMLIALGGDGTILAAARSIGETNVPILGVKVGGLGFLSDIVPEELPGALDAVKSGQYKLSPRMTLEMVFDGQTYFALNDLVIDKGASPRILELAIHVGGQFVNTLTADGLIIATPTGSTAYTLSVGGPIVHPRLLAIIISPICPHLLANRPMILSGDQSVDVLIKKAHGDVKLTVDGQLNFTLQQGHHIAIQKGAHSVRLVRTTSRTYYDVLRTKLKWGVREG